MSTFKVEIVEIESIEKHPNADKLQIAKLTGMEWQCIIPTNEFKPGDLAVYFPIDSVLPIEVESKLFGPDSKVKLHHSRIKTIKLRGAISQGLLAKPELFGYYQNSPNKGSLIRQGDDLTNLLKVIKYEPPASLSPQSKANQTSKKQVNPNFHKYTSIENFKNYSGLFEEGEFVIVTEKIHGTNFRAGWVKTEVNTLLKRVKRLLGLLPEYEFVYGSHNVQLQSKWLYSGFYDTNVYAEAVVKYKLKDIIPKGYVIYGEVYGDGIQKNYHYGCKPGERKLIVFDVQKDGIYLDFVETENLVKFDLNLPMVPVLYYGQYNKEHIKTLVSGDSVLAPSQKVREGIVIKPIKETKCFMGRKMLKFISDEYLLKDNTDFH